jgi:hypothetical protein
MTLADTPPADLAQTFIEKWASGDLDEVAARVDPEISYEGPMARTEGAAAYLDVVGPFSRVVTGINILAVTAAGDQAMIMYEMETTPFGTLAAADLLRFKDGRILTSRLVFDTHPVDLAESSD